MYLIKNNMAPSLFAMSIVFCIHYIWKFISYHHVIVAYENIFIVT